MIFVGRRGLTYQLAAIACVAVVVLLPSFKCSPITNNEETATSQTTQDREDGPNADLTNALTTVPDDGQLTDLAVKDTSLGK